MARNTLKLPPKTISGINLLPAQEKRDIYLRLVPDELFDHLNIPRSLIDAKGNDLFNLDCAPGCSDAEMSVFHKYGHPDPVLYGHITDTISGQIHILLYVINDPNSERYNVDKLPDGTPTLLGAAERNLDEEARAMRSGLAPGQIHHGLRMLKVATDQFEDFVESIGHNLYFAEPLYYHNAILFERYGFTYARGKKLMEAIQAGFLPGGEFIKRLDGSTPFRQPEAVNSIRLRSWAIHDGIIGEPFNGVTMYKRVRNQAGINTSNGCPW